ncbi:hypothetical protein K502DRAFT_144024 [Neoconidiobolus thromboides FSU 785]|nr:hypothetical protein K502DRAFT_144024 [Neoconidiobolus thromboides FSU 785]
MKKTPSQRKSVIHPLEQKEDDIKESVIAIKHINSTSFGNKIIEWIKKESEVFSKDILHLLKLKKASLILPICDYDILLQRNTIEDYILLTTDFIKLTPFTSLSFLTMFINDTKLFTIKSDKLSSKEIVPYFMNNKLDFKGIEIVDKFEQVLFDNIACNIIIVNNLLTIIEPWPPILNTINDVFMFYNPLKLANEQYQLTLDYGEKLNELFKKEDIKLTELMHQLHNYYDQLYNLFNNNPLSSKNLFHELEVYLCNNYYNKLFQPDDSGDILLDSQFQQQLAVIKKDNIILTKLRTNCNTEIEDDLLKDLITELTTITLLKTPSSKLKLLINFNNKLSNNSSMDMILPKIIYSLTYLKEEIYLISNIRFIQRWSSYLLFN